jgi:hypothetical protein
LKCFSEVRSVAPHVYRGIPVRELPPHEPSHIDDDVFGGSLPSVRELYDGFWFSGNVVGTQRNASNGNSWAVLKRHRAFGGVGALSGGIGRSQRHEQAENAEKRDQPIDAEHVRFKRHLLLALASFSLYFVGTLWCSRDGYLKWLGNGLRILGAIGLFSAFGGYAVGGIGIFWRFGWWL